MVPSASRVATTWTWLATFAYAYLVFVTSIKLVTTGVRWAAALVCASTAYGLVMLFLAAFWQHSGANGAICCAGSMMVAVLCGASVASTILAPRHRRMGVWTCTVFGMIYPLMLAAGSAPDAPVRAMEFTYVAAAAAGGIAALWTLPSVRNGSNLGAVHA